MCIDCRCVLRSTFSGIFENLECFGVPILRYFGHQERLKMGLQNWCEKVLKKVMQVAAREPDPGAVGPSK